MNSSSTELPESSVAAAKRFEAAYAQVWFALHHADDGDDSLGQLERQVLQHVIGDTSPTDVARHLGLAKSTTTVVLQRLAAKGLVSRERPANDGRRVIVRRTTQGDVLASNHSVLRIGALAAALARLPKTARAELIGHLERLAREASLG